MTIPTYANFDLLLFRSGENYGAKVLFSPAGEASAEFALPLSEQERRIALWLLGRTRNVGVAMAQPVEANRASLRELGERLFLAVFAGKVGVQLRRSLDMAQAQGAGLRIRLRLDQSVPELADLPWEFLFDPDLDRFLALSDLTPIVRYPEQAEPVQPLRVTPPLTLLAVLSSPANVPELAVEQEWQRLQNALLTLQAGRQIAPERLETATLPALQARLRRGPVHLLHFIGHGYFDPDSNSGGLVFENAAGQAERVPAETLGMLLHDHAPLRLAFLNACEGARGGRSDPFAGVAQRLVQQGVPAVLAMQFPISDAAAIALSQEFYGALADGHPADAALSEARKAVFALGNEREWGTPVLFSRSDDNRLIEPPQGDFRAVIELKPFEPETVLIPGGPFLMGTAPGDGIPDHETPQHEVSLPTYRIGKYAVLNREYEVFVREARRLANPEMRWDGQSPPSGKEEHPVSGVTWCDAVAYCLWLSAKTGRLYVLPTEGHWEKAARGVDGRIYPWGDAWDATRCHHGQPDTAAKDAYGPQSVYGCFNMVGNVREWTSTLWGESVVEPDKRYHYPWQEDGRNALTANSEVRRIVRGGSASDPPDKLRCAARASYLPLQPGPFGKRHGFRVMMLIEPARQEVAFCQPEDRKS